jgi:hypothetical protein
LTENERKADSSSALWKLITAVIVITAAVIAIVAIVIIFRISRRPASKLENPGSYSVELGGSSEGTESTDGPTILITGHFPIAGYGDEAPDAVSTWDDN